MVQEEKRIKGTMGEAGAAVEGRAAAAVRMIQRTVGLISPERCCLSFNGGKDSTVLLHLLRAALPDTYQQLHYVYFDQPNEFPEVEAFITSISNQYSIKIKYIAGTFQEGLAQLLRETEVQVIFLGTRRADPHGHTLETLSLTSGSWPNCIRAHPILRWDYADVWAYLHGEHLPYCELYDRGYTSLGSTLTTIPHPALCRPDGSYGPASELHDGTLERDNRLGVQKASGAAGVPSKGGMGALPSMTLLGTFVVGVSLGVFVATKLPSATAIR